MFKCVWLHFAGVIISKTLFTMNTFMLLAVTKNNISLSWTVCFGAVGISDGTRGGIVVKALRYKPAGHGFDS